RNDEVTQLGKDYTKILSEVEQHSRNKSYHEQQARNYQELLSQGESLSFSQRNNLMDSAMKIAQKEHGLSHKEAFNLLNSQNPESAKIFREAYDKNSESRRGDSFMKQPNFARFSNKNSLRNEFQQKVQTFTNNPEFDQQSQQIKADMDHGMVQISDSTIKQNIQKQGQSIQSKNQKIGKELQERSNMVATTAAVNQLKDAWKK
ncbi:MAG: hypothetical protein LBS23_01095, partial [Holosporaceae bacterium]|nr:hypothetical protein [Holosporaceae bacterium]